MEFDFDMRLRRNPTTVFGPLSGGAFATAAAAAPSVDSYMHRRRVRARGDEGSAPSSPPPPPTPTPPPTMYVPAATLGVEPTEIVYMRGGGSGGGGGGAGAAGTVMRGMCFVLVFGALVLAGTYMAMGMTGVGVALGDGDDDTPAPSPSPTPEPTAAPGPGSFENDGDVLPSSPPPTVVAIATPAPTVAAAIAAATNITLRALCNMVNGDGTCVAVFSYVNVGSDDGLAVVAADTYDVVPYGARDNVVVPAAVQGTQPSAFERGLHYGGAWYTWPCGAAAYTRWTLRGGAAALLPAAAVRCPTLAEAALAVAALDNSDGAVVL